MAVGNRKIYPNSGIIPMNRRFILAVLLCFGMENIPQLFAATTTLALPQKGVYSGAYIDFGPTEDHVTAMAISHFESLIKKRLAIVAFSNYWGENAFPITQLKTIQHSGAFPLIFWSPWEQPYEQSRPNKLNLHLIRAGKYNSYIDRWADAAKSYGQPLLVSWGLEMNGNWFPWSGVFHGGGKKINGQYLGPETYKNAYRYIVDRVRARGANQILWVFHVNGYAEPQALWNRMAQYYPGAKYVDWLGLSAYGKQFPYQDWSSAADAMDNYYHELSLVDPDKPIILAEWGVGEFPKSGNKAQYIHDALERIIYHYSRMKAAVFWHERWQNEDNSFSDLRVNSSPAALNAYQKGIANPLWLERIIWE